MRLGLPWHVREISWACFLLQLSFSWLQAARLHVGTHSEHVASIHWCPWRSPGQKGNSHVHEQSMFHHSAHAGIPSMDALEFLLLVGAIRLQCHRVIRLISHDSILKKKTLQQHVRLNYLKICRMSIVDQQNSHNSAQKPPLRHVILGWHAGLSSTLETWLHLAETGAWWKLEPG